MQACPSVKPSFEDGIREQWWNDADKGKLRC